MTSFTPVSAIIGGACIGIAAVMLFRLIGRIAGVSGIVFGLFSGAAADRYWRALFVAGLLLGGVLYPLISGQPLTADSGASLGLVGLAGLLVGIGTRLGSGCTSGHGVCGMARFSLRSLVATLTFLAFGVVTATLVHGVFAA